jgi:hypothetical protein
VLGAAADWVWVPQDALEVKGDGYRLVRYPDRLLDPTFPAAQVLWLKTARPFADVLTEIAAQVRAWEFDEVHWWLSAATQPTASEQELCARGGELSETVQILGLDLGEGLPQLDPPCDVTVELVTNEHTFRASSDVMVRGWGRAELDESELARQLDEILRDLQNWSSFRVIAFAEGRPISTGGCTLEGEVAQLWSAVTLPDARHRGGYRAVLAERLRLAREHGATLALVEGRTVTSGPTLLRAGFTDYGQKKRYRLQLS